MFLPESIWMILNRLNQAGYQAYVVGGCVRDALLKKPCADYDICTQARPTEIESLFEHTVPTGIRHGTITVLTPDPVEVTTFRNESVYTDHRHPDEVHFVSTIEEDLARRDFTINAMAYHPETGLIDPFGGQKDLKRKIVRCVGDPNRRFQEDALRMLRAHRFCARLHFNLDDSTEKALQRNTDLIRYVSVERVVKELNEILETDPYRIEQMVDLLSLWIPELKECLNCEQNTPWHDTNVLHHTLRAISFLEPFDLTLAYALLCHDLGKPQVKITKEGRDHFYGHPQVSSVIAKRIVKDLKLPKKEQILIPQFILYHDEKLKCDLKTIYRFRIKYNLSDTWMRQLFTIKRCDILAHSIKGRQTMSDLEAFISFYEENLNRPLSISDLKISGKDIQKEIGLQGPKIKEALDFCLQEAFYHPEKNDKENWIHRLKER